MNKRPKDYYGPTRTQAHFQDECDINRIIKRGRPNHFAPAQFHTGVIDYTKMPTSYAEAMQFTMDIQKQFNQIKPEIRGMFHNNPQELINFIDNPANRAQAQKLGLLPPDRNPPAKRSEKAAPTAKNASNLVPFNVTPSEMEAILAGRKVNIDGKGTLTPVPNAD